MSGDQVKAAFQGAHRYDLGIIGAGVLAFIFSLFPYYTVDFSVVSESFTAWHGFFGWFGTLCALAGAGLLVAKLLGATLSIPLRLTVLALFGVALLCTMLAWFVWPGGGCQGIQACEDATGHGFGYWLSLIVIAAGTALAFMRKDATD